jgi:hypothetical protein
MTGRASTRGITGWPFDRFLDGFSHVGGSPPLEPESPPDLVVDVIRGADLLAIRIEGFGVELIGGKPPMLRTVQEGGLLVANYTFQHLAERAIYEEKVDPPVEDDNSDPDPPGAQFNPPILARPAKSSRVVFVLPAGEKIPFTSSGLLEAMSQLEMSVHPLARPRSRTFPFPPGDILGLDTGLVGVVTERGLVVGPRSARSRATEVDLVTRMRERRVARAIVARLGAFASTRAELGVDSVAVDVPIGDREVRIPGISGPGGIVRGDLDIVLPRRPSLSREPRPNETAIEAPYRLIISPSAHGGWAHATNPVGAVDAENRIELWHSRLGVRREASDGSIDIDETSTYQRIIRAVWARDREGMIDWATDLKPTHTDDPFRTSLDGADRHMLVRQSSETWVGARGRRLAPEPVDADSLYLSAIGAWLDLHGEWNTTPYSTAGMSSIESWDHLAPMGRDQFVRVVYPGYLWPFGHRASLVKLTERKMKDASPSIAGLYQRMFLVIKEPVKRYSLNDLPFTEVRIEPLVTPTLNPPPAGDEFNEAFVPKVNGAPFAFRVHARDHEDRAVRMVTPLTWVAEAFTNGPEIRLVHAPHAAIPVEGQTVAFAPVKKGGDTALPAETITFDAEPFVGGSTPLMTTAAVTIAAVEHLSPVGPVSLSYFSTYVTDAFDPGVNAGEVWAQLTNPVQLAFGGAAASGSDKAGGFIQPDLSVGGLSRLKGTVDDLAKVAVDDFDPLTFLQGVSPKLFGLVNLVDLLQKVGLDLSSAPSVITETVDRIEGFVDDLKRAIAMVEDAVAEAAKLQDRAVDKAQELIDRADDAHAAAVALRDDVVGAAQDIIDALEALVDGDPVDIETNLQPLLDALLALVGDIRTVSAQLPPLIRHKLDSMAGVLEAILDAVDLIEDIILFLQGIGSSSASFSYRYEWTPPMESWPAGSPIIVLEPDSLVLAVEGRINGKGEVGVEALAELRDFSLLLLPGTELVEFAFDHLSFRAGSSGKPEVDVVMGDITFLGLLGFIEVLKELIPLDGFSDPPFLDVTAAGVTAGFTQDLPNVAIGVFSLSNLSLGADVQVPFLGEVVSVGFNFCTRERPFTLAVTFIGGGGFFGMRLSPTGLVVLELALEAGAVLAVDLGVASGSVSAMLGIYIRLEGDAGSLAGYFRLRGEVDVLGLISASIELYLELAYDFGTGKMVGSASLTVKVEVLFFSTSVTISAERQFAGSNGDPSFVDIMGLESDGSSPAWSDYCLAFA